MLTQLTSFNRAIIVLNILDVKQNWQYYRANIYSKISYLRTNNADVKMNVFFCLIKVMIVAKMDST